MVCYQPYESSIFRWPLPKRRSTLDLGHNRTTVQVPRRLWLKLAQTPCSNVISRPWGLKSPQKISVISRSADSGFIVIRYTGKLLLNFPDFLDSATRRPNFDSEQGETLLLSWKGRAHLRVLQDATQFRGRLKSLVILYDSFTSLI